MTPEAPVSVNDDCSGFLSLRKRVLKRVIKLGNINIKPIDPQSACDDYSPISIIRYLICICQIF